MPRDGILKLEGHQNRFVTAWEKCTQNGAVVLWAGRRTGGNSETALDVRAHEPQCSFFSNEYADRSSLAPGLFTTMAHTTRRFLRPRDEDTRHALLPSSEMHALHGSAEPSMADVLLSM